MGESITRKRQKNHRIEKILDASLKLFCERGIDETSIEEVAKCAGVGPATIYRYFTTKVELAVRSAVFYWEKIADAYVDRLTKTEYLDSEGRKQLKQIMDLFLDLFEHEYLFLKFLYEFDAFVLKYDIGWERLEEYEACILDLKQYVTRALEKGLEDGSLFFDYSVDEVYFTLMHLMLSMMQKLTVKGHILPSDERVDVSLQLKIATQILLQGLASSVT